MRGQNTIVINGKVYDTLTGLPVAAPDPAPVAQPKVAAAVKRPTNGTNLSGISRPANSHKKVHRTHQRSATLRRDILNKPKTHQAPVHQAVSKRRSSHVQRSGMITKFAPHPQPLKPRATAPAPTAEKVSPVVAKAHRRVTKPVNKTPEKLSSRALKEKLIAQRLSQVDDRPKPAHKAPRRGLFSAQPRVASILTACLAIVLLGGYLTYLNMPGLSVRVAAAQAGVEASFPEYRPDGYRLDGPVAFSPGEVNINFKANGGPQAFTLSQQTSSWDSQAVLDNYVEPKDVAYVTSSEQGLTIYTFGNGAAWVNGGILYTIEGDAPLTNEQVLRMAASL